MQWLWSTLRLSQLIGQVGMRTTPLLASQLMQTLQELQPVVQSCLANGFSRCSILLCNFMYVCINCCGQQMQQPMLDKSLHIAVLNCFDFFAQPNWLISSRKASHGFRLRTVGNLDKDPPQGQLFTQILWVTWLPCGSAHADLNSPELAWTSEKFWTVPFEISSSCHSPDGCPSTWLLCLSGSANLFYHTSICVSACNSKFLALCLQ